MVARRRALSSLAALALVCGMSTALSAQTVCTREGDWLVCPDGERRFISPEPDARPSLGRWRGWPGASTDEGGRDAWLNDSARFQGPDGRICWPHGDHFHCR